MVKKKNLGLKVIQMPTITCSVDSTARELHTVNLREEKERSEEIR